MSVRCPSICLTHRYPVETVQQIMKHFTIGYSSFRNTKYYGNIPTEPLALTGALKAGDMKKLRFSVNISEIIQDMTIVTIKDE